MKIVYMDNAATSYPKPKQVIKQICRCMNRYCANPGRSSHRMAIESSQHVMNTRVKLADFFNIANSLNVVFTPNATYAINYILKGLIKANQHVITTCMDHNSVLRPLKSLQKKLGVELDIIQCDDKGDLDPDDVEKAIKENTQLIVCTYSSNVNGTIMPVKEIGSIAKRHGLKFLLDASQGAGCFNIDIKEIGANFIALSGHKGLMGPQGTGILAFAEKTDIDTIIEGGTGSTSASLEQPDLMPDMLESGTLNVPGIAGLGAAVEYIKSIGLDKIKKHKMELCQYLIDGFSSMEHVDLYSHSVDKNSGIVAINVKGMDSSEVSSLLDNRFAIATRPGLHCAPEAHKALGTINSGIVRISPGWFNTRKDVHKLLYAIERIR